MENYIKICNLCNLKYTNDHVCEQDINEYIYCKICDFYLLRHEFKDHIYCHSLEVGRNNNAIEEVKEEIKKIEEDYDIVQRQEIEEIKEERKEEIKEEIKINNDSVSSQVTNNNVSSSSGTGGGFLNRIRNFPYDKLRIYNTNISIGSLIENTLLNIIGISLQTTIENNSPSYDNEGNYQKKTDQSLIEQLPEITLDDKVKLPVDKKECIICLIEFEKSDKVIILPCFHVFHTKCITDWLNNSIFCPLCKFKIIEKNIKNEN